MSRPKQLYPIKGDVQQVDCLMPEKVSPQHDNTVSKPLDSFRAGPDVKRTAVA
jgi:hypothetical protein